MPEYKYQAITQRGRAIKGQITANDELELETILSEKALTLVSFKEKSAGLPFLKARSKNVPLRALGEFYHRLAQSLHMGIPVVVALKETSEVLPSPYLAEVSLKLKDSIESGRGLSEAMAQYGHIFQELDLGLLRLGEQTGKLPGALENLAAYIEWKEDLRSTIKRAVIYPSFIMLSIVAIVAVWVGYVLPQMAGLLKEMGVELPQLTLLLLDTSEFLQNYWLELIVGIIATVLGIYLALKHPIIKFYFHRYLLKVPVIGKTIMGLGLARLSRNFATAYRSGMGILNILDMLTQNVVGNLYLETALIGVRQDVEMGRTLTESFQFAEAFPPMLIGAVKSGESTAGLDTSFERLGNYYDTEVKRNVQALIAALEPITLMVLGGIFGMIILSILLPLYDVMGAAQGGY